VRICSAAFRFPWRRFAGIPVRSLVGEDGMRHNALFQLATGLGTPGTARKEDLAIATPASVQTEERADHFVMRNGVRCAGAHLIVDLYEAERLDDIDHIEETLRHCVEAAGATLLHIHLHHFEPNGGVSGVAVLAESHISIHTWPENGYAALDVFMCGKAKPDACVPVLREAFKPSRVALSELLRGQGA
jgi:S-adenosylmethionine decarboxylase